MTAQEHGVCIEDYTGCSLTQDLFMDDVMLWQVTSARDLAPGSWLWEGDSIFVADDPTDRRVELSVASHAFLSNADNVTIRGIVVEKYATPAQSGAIQSGDFNNDAVGSGWIIEDTEVRLNHGVGVRAGERAVLRNVFAHSNGQLGIALSGGSDGLIEDCEIANNNVAGFDWGWEAGGAKFTVTSGLIVRRTWSHDNNGPGLWTDISNRDTVYEDNLVVDNTGPGIFHEISYAAVIRNNTVIGNGHGSSAWLWGSGILVAASSDVEIHGNTVTGNADGIGGIQQARDDGPEEPYLLANMHVHDNTISVERGHIGVVEDVGDRAVFTERNNRFEANTYVDTDGHRYYWRGRKLDAEGWVEAGQDIEGEWR
jgi:parallel beta-helix repeat protein